MKYRDLLEGTQPPSQELIAWLYRWVESSHQVEDQIALFEHVRDDAERFLNVSYPVIYRGLSITDEERATLEKDGRVTIAAHRLASWTKSRSIADDYALPGHGGDVGVLVRKTGRQAQVVLDIENLVRAIGRRKLEKVLGSRDRATDAGREREVVVESDGSLTIERRDVVKIV